MKKIYYISFTRFPSEKAHAVYMAKSCEAFSLQGCDTTLLVPKRFGLADVDLHEAYGVENNFTIKYLPAIDFLPLSFLKTLWHRVGLVSFGCSVLFYIIFLKKNSAYFFTNDVFIALIVSFLSKRVVYEMHDYPEKNMWLYKCAGKKVHKILTNNNQKVTRVVRDLNVSKNKVFAVHNGVTIDDFDIPLTKKDARKKLSLTLGKKYVVYTGHLYEWKGVDVLAQASVYMPEATVLFVGGTKNDIERMQKRYVSSKNIVFCGHKAHAEIPVYLKAADVLVLPNTDKVKISSRHTSPMKLFEYMASKCSIVASNIPSIREVLNDANSTLVTPDSSEELASVILGALESHGVQKKVNQAYKDVKEYTWRHRAKKIISAVHYFREKKIGI